MSHRSRQGWLVFPHMTGRGKGECEKWTKLQRQVPGPLAIPPSSSLEGCPSRKVKDEGMGPLRGISCRVEHAHHESASRCKWPPDGTARCLPGTGLLRAQPLPGTGSHHRRSPACTRSAARSAAQRKAGICVSANMQMPAGELCIPRKLRMSLQNASTAHWDHDRATKSHTASVLPPHPTEHEPQNVTLNPHHMLLQRQLSFRVHSS